MKTRRLYRIKDKNAGPMHVTTQENMQVGPYEVEHRTRVLDVTTETTMGEVVDWLREVHGLERWASAGAEITVEFVSPEGDEADG